VAHGSTLRDIEGQGDLAVGHIKDRSEKQAGSGGLIESLERPGYSVIKRGLILQELAAPGKDGPLGVAWGAGDAVGLLKDGGGPHAPAARLVESGVADEAPHPGEKTGAGLELVEFLHGRECRILNDILCTRPVSQDPRRDIPQSPGTGRELLRELGAPEDRVGAGKTRRSGAAAQAANGRDRR